MIDNLLDDLKQGASALADELTREFDELLQPRRLSLDDPVERIAAGCSAFINQALNDPAWGALIVRGATAMPDVARVAGAGPRHRTCYAKHNKITF